jgi:two-component system, chemotaxis family, chemotaxis protein CheY
MSSATVLVVDDDAFARAVVKEALANALPGHRVIEAADGAQALALLETEKPELVFLDLLMPNKSGIETLPEIRKRSPSSRVFVVSSMETDLMVKAALDAGAVGFIGKPFHPDEIAAAARGTHKGSRE